ncbi:bifunctional serine/threonine-protein kinase/formylglycine-generating enzyme family protein [Methylobacterium dankookense]|uniref:Serine/threonine-protein kinase PknB n=1 Tax=Methylobacterium dankookense TaxID=560405 RepID=A0A564FYQ7_9HYPH|nr:bifunctional serine/threonine-protein kinase/formylglycine-generating enzyme family protein [Methylobacterium dankookense]GJD58860.1 Serine/threonine-protein kinase PknD [Methylobacterium dankookense]VUF13319.1 Serine/threonine-protein kinase PknB [Methylobacterium dankookense]
MKTVVPLHPFDPAFLPKGTRLNGIFEIEELIGQGGMAQVYRARTLEADDAVAIKVVKPEIARDQSLMGLLKKEAQTLSKISHEAIVKHLLFSVDPQLGRPYLAMELVRGPSLADLIKDGPLSVEAVFVLLNRVGTGLDVAHRLGITHRDISPDNIILPRSDPGRAKLIDFGIARNLNEDETIIADRFAGKLKFASPEHLGLNGGKVTPKSDIYSFGLTLAAALIGAPLDLGGTQVEMIRRRQSVPDLGKIDPRIRKILLRMLQPDPAERPDTIADLIQAQEGGSVVLARRAAAAPNPEARRRRGLVAAFGLALVVGGLAGWYGLTRSAGPEPAPTASAEKSRPGDHNPPQAERPGETASQGNPRIEEPPRTAPLQEARREPPLAEPPSPPQAAEEHAPAPPEHPVAAGREAEPPAVSQVPAVLQAPVTVQAPATVQAPVAVQAPAAPQALPTPQAPVSVAGPASDQPLALGRSKRDCSSCPPLVEVPAGSFSMGGTADPSERPAHHVRIQAFLMSRGPVTVGEWNACHAAGRCEFKAEGAPNQPAANLSWDDAQQYVRWISGVTQKAYRLPSEAEWEYAARGGTRTRFWWGDQFRGEMAPCRSSGGTPPDAAPAAADFPDNPFGLLGTTCVIAQWVSDCWHRNYRGAPADGSSWSAPNCKQRVLRGGTWRSRAESERVTSRDFYDPAVRYPGNGVRIARDL